VDKEFLTPGEKLRKIRKKYDLKQHEITNDEVTRNFISMVENNRANLTTRTATIICKKINELIAMKNEIFEIKAKELLKTVQEQIDEKALIYLKEIEKSDSYDEIEKIINFVIGKELSNSVFRLNVKLGDYFYRKNELEKAKFFYNTAFHIDFMNKEIIKDIENSFFNLVKIEFFTENTECFYSLKMFISNKKSFFTDKFIKSLNLYFLLFEIIKNNNILELINYYEMSDDTRSLILGLYNLQLENYSLAISYFDIINSTELIILKLVSKIKAKLYISDKNYKKCLIELKNIIERLKDNEFYDLGLYTLLHFKDHIIIEEDYIVKELNEIEFEKYLNYKLFKEIFFKDSELHLKLKEKNSFEMYKDEKKYNYIYE
jgi:transcriptional regulator with XRE-family HTH domain